MLRNMRFRTKLMLIVAIPMIAALVVAVPGLRTRLRDLDASEQARAQAVPARLVQTFLQRIDDEGSLAAWWVASDDASVAERLRDARRATDAAAANLGRAERRAEQAGADDAARRIHELREAVAVLDQQRQFVDLRLSPDTAVLGSFRDLASKSTDVLDAFAGAPRGAAAAVMFRDEATLARLVTALADERSILAVALSRGELPDTLTADLVAAVTTQNSAMNELESQGRSPTRAAVRIGTDAFSSATDSVRQTRAPALAGRSLPTVTAADWFATATRQLRGWEALSNRITEGIDADLARRQDNTESNLLVVAVGSVGVLLLAGVLAFLLARATTRPLRQLADNAHDVATRQLPALVDALRDPRVEPPTITPIVVRSRDELGALAKAFNDVERTTVSVAELQRDTVRMGISDLYVNLARRNQPLLTRQLGLIEDLEQDERDPDRLGALFTLDHLATRMRRNSDSLLVLAGVDTKAIARPAVPLIDVIRGAVSETSDFQRIDTGGIATDVDIVGYAATDLAHLLSELLENATSLSTPASRVLVVTRPTGTGLELTISDKGIGIAPERMQELNELLADPPPPGLVLSRSLGLVVVGRLARRINVGVRLHSAPEVGTAAVITLPESLIHRGEVDVVEGDAPAADAMHTDVVDADAVDLVAAEATEVETAPTPMAPTAPATDAPPDAPSPLVATPTVPLPAATESSASVGVDTTAAGLPRRAPRAVPEPDAPAPVAAPPTRSPDRVFELIARYEAGRRRAQAQPTDDNDDSDSRP